MNDVMLKSWDEVKAELEKRDRWPINLYYFLRYRIWFSLSEYWRRFKGFFQRGRRGYARYDLWSFDVYLAEVIGNGVHDLCKFSHGYPPEITWEEWERILTKISDGFLYYSKKFDEDEEFEEREKRLDESLELFKKYFRNLWD